MTSYYDTYVYMLSGKSHNTVRTRRRSFSHIRQCPRDVHGAGEPGRHLPCVSVYVRVYIVSTRSFCSSFFRYDRNSANVLLRYSGRFFNGRASRGRKNLEQRKISCHGPWPRSVSVSYLAP